MTKAAAKDTEKQENLDAQAPAEALAPTLPEDDSVPVEIGKSSYIVGLVPRLQHVQTGAVFSAEPKKVVVDAFIVQQIKAKKLKAVAP